MKLILCACIALNILPLSLLAEPVPSTDAALTYSNRPLGTPERPLLLRTFMPDPELGDVVLGYHDRGAESPKYNLTKGKDVPGKYEPIKGLPAAIGVNSGGELSYCWDTVECRLLYAWKDGFLDMKNYWGDPKRGSRQSFGYVPKLVGTMFYKASGKHPLMIGGKSISDLEKPPVFRGFTRKENAITFIFEVNGEKVHCKVGKGDSDYSVTTHYQIMGDAKLSYKEDAKWKITELSEKELRINVQGQELAKYQGNVNENLLKGGVNAKSGKRIFAAMACATCHSLDGSKGHGPSLLALHGSPRKITDVADPVIADDRYILESIRQPNAKVVEGYPKNYMPPYQLKKGEYQALLLYIKTLKK